MFLKRRFQYRDAALVRVLHLVELVTANPVAAEPREHLLFPSIFSIANVEQSSGSGYHCTRRSFTATWPCCRTAALKAICRSPHPREISLSLTLDPARDDVVQPRVRLRPLLCNGFTTNTADTKIPALLSCEVEGSAAQAVLSRGCIIAFATNTTHWANSCRCAWSRHQHRSRYAVCETIFWKIGPMPFFDQSTCCCSELALLGFFLPPSGFLPFGTYHEVFASEYP